MKYDFNITPEEYSCLSSLLSEHFDRVNALDNSSELNKEILMLKIIKGKLVGLNANEFSYLINFIKCKFECPWLDISTKDIMGKIMGKYTIHIFHER